MTRTASKARDLVTRYGQDVAAETCRRERINAQVRGDHDQARYWQRVLAAVERGDNGIPDDWDEAA